MFYTLLTTIICIMTFRPRTQSPILRLNTFKLSPARRPLMPQLLLRILFAQTLAVQTEFSIPKTPKPQQFEIVKNYIKIILL